MRFYWGLKFWLWMAAAAAWSWFPFILFWEFSHAV